MTYPVTILLPSSPKLGYLLFSIPSFNQPLVQGNPWPGTSLDQDCDYWCMCCFFSSHCHFWSSLLVISDLALLLQFVLFSAPSAVCLLWHSSCCLPSSVLLMWFVLDAPPENCSHWFEPSAWWFVLASLGLVPGGLFSPVWAWLSVVCFYQSKPSSRWFVPASPSLAPSDLFSPVQA